MQSANFSIRVLESNSHHEGSITWRAGRLVAAMEGCDVHAIIAALASLERDTTPKGIADPARWLSHFAGLESPDSGKALQPWIEIVHAGQVVKSSAAFRELVKTRA
jgi:hypothetical protein